MCRFTRTESTPVRMSACMLIAHRDHNNTKQVHYVTVMTHVIGLDAGQSGQGHLTPDNVTLDRSHD